MKYTVIWKPSAEEELARLWVNALDRQAVATAADTMDALLQEDPEAQGESRTGLVRIMIVPPLPVHFTVSEPDRLVSVLEVWRSRRPP
jgi:hypothetical protein